VTLFKAHKGWIEMPFVMKKEQCIYRRLKQSVLITKTLEPTRAGRTLQRKEKAGVPEHYILNELNNLGLLYANLGRLDRAEKMYQRVLQGYEKALGLEHTSTLDTVNNLGTLYWKLGRRNDAEKVYESLLVRKFETKEGAAQ
jgi:tetratricopeptide (TPR) repeat protein